MAITNINQHEFYNDPSTGIPWVSKALAYAIIPIKYRYGKVFGVINGASIDEFWWKDESNLADGDEVAKVGSGGGGGTALTTPVVTFGTVVPGQIPVHSTTPTGAMHFLWYRFLANTPPFFGVDTPIHEGDVSSWTDLAQAPLTLYYYFVIVQGYEYLHSAPGGNSVTSGISAGPTTLYYDASKLWDNIDDIDEGSYHYHNALSSTEDTTVADSVDINFYDFQTDVLPEVAVYINGVFKETVTAGTNGANTATVDLVDTSSKTVKMVFGTQQGPNFGTPIKGTYLISKVYNSYAAPIAPTYKTNGMVFIGDSISVGIGTTSPVTDSMVSVLRTQSEFADYDIIAKGYGFKTVYDAWSTSLLITADATSAVAKLANYTGLRIIVIEEGTNDWGFSLDTPIVAATKMGNFIDEVLSLDSTIGVFIITPFLRGSELGYNNGLGYTLDNYRIAEAGVRVGNEANVTIINGRDINFLDHSSDSLHPNTVGVDTELVPALKPQLLAPVGVPVLTYAQISNSAPNQISLEYDDNINTGLGLSYTDFTVAGHTLTAIDITGHIITLTSSVNFTGGEVVFLSGGNSKIKSNANVLAPNFSSEFIINNITVSTTDVNDFFGYGATITGNSVTFPGSGAVASNLFIPNGHSGFAETTIPSGLMGIFGLDLNTNQPTQEYFSIFNNGGYLGVLINGNQINTMVAISTNDKVIVHRDGVGFIRYMYSLDAGSTYRIFMKTSDITGDLHVKAAANGGGSQILDVKYYHN